MEKGKTIHIENDEEQSAELVNRDGNSNNILLGRIVFGEEEAYNLYNAYAYMIGFSIRKGKPRYYEGTREIRLKDFYCSCEGFKDGKEDLSKDVKFKKLDARSGCQAMIRFKVESGQWQVIHHVTEHNHYLALPHERHLLRSALEITIEKANCIKDMVNSGISIINTFNYMSQTAGGPENLGFLERDCYNLVNKEKMMLIEAGDAQSILKQAVHHSSHLVTASRGSKSLKAFVFHKQSHICQIENRSYRCCQKCYSGELEMKRRSTRGYALEQEGHGGDGDEGDGGPKRKTTLMMTSMATLFNFR